jgi:hypothetical protein
MAAADHGRMNNRIRVVLAGVTTAAFMGGLTVGGLALRDPSTSAAPAAPAKPIVRTRVIHQTKVRTVHEPVHKSPPASGSPTPPAQITAVATPAGPVRAVPPRVIAAPRKVTSRVSPTGGHGGDDRGEHAHEGGDD